MTIQQQHVNKLATAAIGDRELAAKWLEKPNAILGGASPCRAMSTVDGYHRVIRQLSWFAGTPFREMTDYANAEETVADLLCDPIMELVLRRAGTGPEELLCLCRNSLGQRRAA